MTRTPFLYLFLSLTLLVGCSKKSPTQPDDPVEQALNRMTIEFSYTASTYTVFISDNVTFDLLPTMEPGDSITHLKLRDISCGEDDFLDVQVRMSNEGGNALTHLARTGFSAVPRACSDGSIPSTIMFRVYALTFKLGSEKPIFNTLKHARYLPPGACHSNPARYAVCKT